MATCDEEKANTATILNDILRAIKIDLQNVEPSLGIEVIEKRNFVFQHHLERFRMALRLKAKIDDVLFRIRHATMHFGKVLLKHTVCNDKMVELIRICLQCGDPPDDRCRLAWNRYKVWLSETQSLGEIWIGQVQSIVADLTEIDDFLELELIWWTDIVKTTHAFVSTGNAAHAIKITMASVGMLAIGILLACEFDGPVFSVVGAAVASVGGFATAGGLYFVIKNIVSARERRNNALGIQEVLSRTQTVVKLFKESYKNQLQKGVEQGQSHFEGETPQHTEGALGVKNALRWECKVNHPEELQIDWICQQVAGNPMSLNNAIESIRQASAELSPLAEDAKQFYLAMCTKLQASP